MKVFDNGSSYAVTVSRREVEQFTTRWPCCSLPQCAITFHFDKRNGDLVDITPNRIVNRVNGPEAAALSEDAQKYGEKRLGNKLEGE